MVSFQSSTSLQLTLYWVTWAPQPCIPLTGLQKRKQSWRTRVPEVVKLLLGGRNSGLDEIHTEFLYVFGLLCVEWRTEVESLYWQTVVTITIFKKYPLSRIFNVRQYFFLTILQMFCTFGEGIWLHPSRYPVAGATGVWGTWPTVPSHCTTTARAQNVGRSLCWK